MKTHVTRLIPGADLKKSIEDFCRERQIRAGYIGTCVGSLIAASLRFAGKPRPEIVQGPFEIVSLVGTVSVNGCHLHLALADSVGQISGGHLTEGCLVYTTAEIVIQDLPEFTFTRKHDDRSGYQELSIEQNED